MTHPRDLKDHPCLAIRAGPKGWQLRSQNESFKLEVSPRVVCNQMSSLMNVALGGAGVALVPAFLCHQELLSGRLRRVLPAWRGPHIPVSLVSVIPTASSARLKWVADQLSSAIDATLRNTHVD